MNWHWPQWTEAALLTLSLWINISRHVKPKTGDEDARIALLALVFMCTILYYGGFWTPAP